VVSSYVSLLESVAARKREEIGERAAGADDLVGLYEKLGCAMPALNQALECLSGALLAPQSGRTASQIAQSCMRESGMAVR
jgi:hypothetical protein